MIKRTLSHINENLTKRALNVSCLDIRKQADQYRCLNHNETFTMEWIYMRRMNKCIVCLIKEMEENLGLTFCSKLEPKSGLKIRHQYIWKCNECKKLYRYTISPKADSTTFKREDVCPCLFEKLRKYTLEKARKRNKVFRENHINDAAYKERKRLIDKRSRDNRSEERKMEIRERKKEMAAQRRQDPDKRELDNANRRKKRVVDIPVNTDD